MSTPTKQEAMDAIDLLLRYIGTDTHNEHFRDTAKRVISSYSQIYGGYNIDIADIFDLKSYNSADFQDVILMKNIKFHSTCAHHMLPISGTASISYIPNTKIIGISKLVRVVDMFAKRLQVQETLTAQIANAIQENLEPLGVAVKISASHYCMVMRGVNQQSALLDTYHFTGIFNQDRQYRNDFINSIDRG